LIFYATCFLKEGDVTYTINASATADCSTKDPNSSIVCYLPNFTLDTSSVSGELTANVFASNGLASENLDTNSLSFDQITIRQISDLNPNATDDIQDKLVVYGSHLYFLADDSSGFRKYFRTDGSNIEKFTDLFSGDDDIPNSWLGSSHTVVHSGNLYFVAETSNGVRKLFEYDGTNLTKLSNTAEHELMDDAPKHLHSHNGNLYFVANGAWNGTDYRRLYEYDGTNINQITSIMTNEDTVSNLATYGTDLYFVSDSNQNVNQYTNERLFRYDGTKVDRITHIRSTTDDVNNLIVFNSKLHFFARDSGGYIRLMDYDGTTINKISNIRSSNNDYPTSTSSGLMKVYNSKLLVNLSDDTGVMHIYEYDGSTLSKLFQCASNQTAKFGPVYNGNLYFSQNGELYMYDGTSIFQVVNMRTGSDGIYNMVVFNDYLYYSGLDQFGRSKLFRLCDTRGSCTN
jgi:hypothetical protein